MFCTWPLLLSFTRSHEPNEPEKPQHPQDSHLEWKWVKSRPRTGANHPKTAWFDSVDMLPTLAAKKTHVICKILDARLFIVCSVGFQGLLSHLFPFHSSLIRAARFWMFSKHPSNQAAMRMTPKPLTFETGRNGMTQASAMASKTKAKSKTWVRCTRGASRGYSP